MKRFTTGLTVSRRPLGIDNWFINITATGGPLIPRDVAAGMLEMPLRNPRSPCATSNLSTVLLTSGTDTYTDTLHDWAERVPTAPLAYAWFTDAYNAINATDGGQHLWYTLKKSCGIYPDYYNLFFSVFIKINESVSSSYWVSPGKIYRQTNRRVSRLSTVPKCINFTRSEGVNLNFKFKS